MGDALHLHGGPIRIGRSWGQKILGNGRIHLQHQRPDDGLTIRHEHLTQQLKILIPLVQNLKLNIRVPAL